MKLKWKFKYLKINKKKKLKFQKCFHTFCFRCSTFNYLTLVAKPSRFYPLFFLSPSLSREVDGAKFSGWLHSLAIWRAFPRCTGTDNERDFQLFKAVNGTAIFFCFCFCFSYPIDRVNSRECFGAKSASWVIEVHSIVYTFAIITDCLHRVTIRRLRMCWNCNQLWMRKSSC